MRQELASGLGHSHYLEQVTVRVLKVETAAAPASIDFLVGVVKWSAAVGETLCLDTTEDVIELRIADVEGVMMAFDRLGTALGFRLAGEVKRQAFVDLNLREVAPLDL